MAGYLTHSKCSTKISNYHYSKSKAVRVRRAIRADGQSYMYGCLIYPHCYIMVDKDWEWGAKLLIKHLLLRYIYPMKPQK